MARWRYGVIRVDGAGEATAAAARRFRQILQVGQLVIFEKAEWLVASIHTNVDLPVVVLAPQRIEAAS